MMNPHRIAIEGDPIAQASGALVPDKKLTHGHRALTPSVEAGASQQTVSDRITILKALSRKSNCSSKFLIYHILS
jgi:hypothetical protein